MVGPSPCVLFSSGAAAHALRFTCSSLRPVLVAGACGATVTIPGKTPNTGLFALDGNARQLCDRSLDSAVSALMVVALIVGSLAVSVVMVVQASACFQHYVATVLLLFVAFSFDWYGRAGKWCLLLFCAGCISLHADSACFCTPQS